MRILKAVAPALCAACLAGAAHADGSGLKLLSTGAMPKMGGYMPQRLDLSPTRPASVTKTPTDASSPLYGVLKMGPPGAQTSFVIMVDEPDGRDARLFVDSNANGDLTDDPAAQWNKRSYQGSGGTAYNQYMGGATVDLKINRTPAPLHLGMYRFDKNDAGRPALKNVLLYYADYAYDGEINLGGQTYKAMLADRMATGDFSGKGATLFVDVNGNGRFDARGEAYDVAKPFNIKGTTYELTGLDAPAMKLQAVKSKQTVAEILPPPDLSPGSKAIPFKLKTMDGTEVTFPGTYKGKVVMLDFWATWCGPCVAELPNLISAYNKYHSRGFEVLGITLDQQNAAAKVTSFTKEKGMPWPQIYDGKFWQAEVAQLYVVQSIPCAYLVDGDTGKIIAASDNGKYADLRGAALAPTIEKSLAAKGR